MEDRFAFRILHRLLDGGLVAQSSLDENGPIINRAAVALRQIIEHGHLMSRVEQFLYAHRPNITRSPGDEYFHVHESNFRVRTRQRQSGGVIYHGEGFLWI